MRICLMSCPYVWLSLHKDVLTLLATLGSALCSEHTSAEHFSHWFWDCLCRHSSFQVCVCGSSGRLGQQQPWVEISSQADGAGSFGGSSALELALAQFLSVGGGHSSPCVSV